MIFDNYRMIIGINKFSRVISSVKTITSGFQVSCVLSPKTITYPRKSSATGRVIRYFAWFKYPKKLFDAFIRTHYVNLLFCRWSVDVLILILDWTVLWKVIQSEVSRNDHQRNSEEVPYCITVSVLNYVRVENILRCVIYKYPWRLTRWFSHIQHQNWWDISISTCICKFCVIYHKSSTINNKFLWKLCFLTNNHFHFDYEWSLISHWYLFDVVIHFKITFVLQIGW